MKSPDLRLIPSVPAEVEWAYLVNETLSGEKAIVPLLQEILRAPQTSPPLRNRIEQQLEEEITHVRNDYVEWPPFSGRVVALGFTPSPDTFAPTSWVRRSPVTSASFSGCTSRQ